LQWDSNLQAAAQNWANHLAQVNSLDHDPNAGAGENIALFSPASDTILTQAAALWLAEKAAYVYGVFDGSQAEAAGHYTQVSFVLCFFSRGVLLCSWREEVGWWWWW
jgi:hypothetical protein